MVNRVEAQLIAALTQPHDLNFRDFRTVERLLGALFGGQEPKGSSAGYRPDIIIQRTHGTPIGVEFKVTSVPIFGKNTNNRVSELLSSAVQMRRGLSKNAILSAVIVVSDYDNDELTKLSNRTNSLVRRMDSLASRLLKADDGVGYDSILFGYVTSGFRWYYYTPNGTHSNGVTYEGPLSTSHAVDCLRDPIISPHRKPQIPKIHKKRRILLVADEWRSGRGGITTINRELAIALASADAEPIVLVPQVSDVDSKSSSEVGVSLVTPARVPGLTKRETLLLKPIFADHSWEPDVIVGHGRILGSYAAAQQQQFFPNAHLVHFVHTDAEQLESSKEEMRGDSHIASANERRDLECNLARSADLVVGVGPLLTETIRDDLIGSDPQPSVICLVPGLRKALKISSLPVRNHVLIVGRADDFHSKGMDIAAEALLKVVAKWPKDKPHAPVLIIRGVPYERATGVKNQLDELFEGQVKYHLRPYSDSEEKVMQDVTQARMLLMPSRHEGFGLSAYEAIANCVPILISSESGLAHFLRQSLIDTDPSSIVEIRDSSTEYAVDRWEKAIQYSLDHPIDARVRACELKSAVTRVADWQKSAEALLTAIDTSLPH